MSAWQQIVDFFTGRGYSQAQAQGIAGNLYGESKYDPNAKGDYMGGEYTAFGLAQWRDKRLADFQRIFNKPLQGSSFDEQLAFIDWELKNTERADAGQLRSQTTVEGATEAFMRYYERPANMSSLPTRVAAAVGDLGKKIKGGDGTNIGVADIMDWAKAVISGESRNESWTEWAKRKNKELDPAQLGKDAREAVDGSSPVAWLKSFFSGEMAGRFSAVIIGVILVALAIAAFVFLSEQKVVQSVVAKAT